MSTKTKSSFLRTLAISVTAFGCAAGLLLPFSTVVTQGRAAPGNVTKLAKRAHRITLRVNDSPEGSRVELTADQSLDSYEAHRRGYRFYLQIPRTEVPDVDTLRGRAFTRVEVEPRSEATILSFHLAPGATARVEQWRNKLEIVFTVSRERVTSSVAPARAHLHDTHTPPLPVDRRSVKAKSGASTSIKLEAVNTNRGTKTTSVSTGRRKYSGRGLNSEPLKEAAADETDVADTATVQEEAVPAVYTTANAPAPREISVEREKAAVTTVTANAAPNSVWTNLKNRGRNTLQIAQLNPVPFGIGAALLLFLVMMAVVRRRRANGNRRGLVLEDSSSDEVLAEETVTVAGVTAPTTKYQGVSAANDRDAETTSNAIGKLVLDNTHRAEIMGSRCAEDRKAIEASLLQVLSATASSEKDRCRARQALEEYGFVAQRSAALLKGRDAWERASAARTLGMIGSKTSMPFLIEALKDADSVVRNEAVASLAALKDPAALGALLEASRKNPDVPASLLTEALSACSVDSLGFLDAPSSEAVMKGSDSVNFDAQWDELAQADATDEILSGWLEGPDNTQEETGDDSQSNLALERQGLRPVHARSYLRVVA